jgi:hypothetical protein
MSESLGHGHKCSYCTMLLAMVSHMHDTVRIAERTDALTKKKIEEKNCLRRLLLLHRRRTLFERKKKRGGGEGA